MKKYKVDSKAFYTGDRACVWLRDAKGDPEIAYMETKAADAVHIGDEVFFQENPKGFGTDELILCETEKGGDK